MSIYDEMRVVAKEVLTEFKQGGIKYVRLNAAVGPPDNPGVPSETSFVIDDGVARGVEYKYVDGTQVVASDGQITCGAPQQFTPNIKDYVEVGGQRHKIRRVTAIPPTGTPVAYTIIYAR